MKYVTGKPELPYLLGGKPMIRLISCEFNIDAACVELKFTDGNMTSQRIGGLINTSKCRI